MDIKIPLSCQKHFLFSGCYKVCLLKFCLLSNGNISLHTIAVARIHRGNTIGAKEKVQVKTNQALLALTNDSVLHVGYWAIIQFCVHNDATYVRRFHPISLEASLIQCFKFILPLKRKCQRFSCRLDDHLGV